MWYLEIIRIGRREVYHQRDTKEDILKLAEEIYRTICICFTQPYELYNFTGNVEEVFYLPNLGMVGKVKQK